MDSKIRHNKNVLMDTAIVTEEILEDMNYIDDELDELTKTAEVDLISKEFKELKAKLYSIRERIIVEHDKLK